MSKVLNIVFKKIVLSLRSKYKRQAGTEDYFILISYTCGKNHAPHSKTMKST